MGGISMMRNVCTSVYGILMLVAAVIPPAIVIIEKVFS